MNVRDDFIQSHRSGAVVVEQINNDLGDFDSEEITANADLIAAAPELYDALENSIAAIVALRDAYQACTVTGDPRGASQVSRGHSPRRPCQSPRRGCGG
jgi:hypothetical protein